VDRLQGDVGVIGLDAATPGAERGAARPTLVGSRVPDAIFNVLGFAIGAVVAPVVTIGLGVHIARAASGAATSR
jgi:hypothetical protein